MTSEKAELINEEEYKIEMETKVIPYLKKYGTEETMCSFDGQEIFCRYYLKENAQASVVVCHGFTESSQKFMEMIYYFHKHGYNVFALDHRGHGKSYREVADTSVTHINKFDDYVNDLNCYIEKVVRKKSGELPLYLYAHSMGGAIGIVYMMKYPKVFERALLTAPMVFPETAGVPPIATRMLAGFFCLIGKKRERVFLQSGFDPTPDFENSNATSRQRYLYVNGLKADNVEYQNCSASYGWVKESMKIIKTILNKKECEKIKTKILLLQAEIDGSVKKEYQPVFVKMVDGAKIAEIKGSKHEIYLSPNNVLEEYLEKIFDFFDK